jgi:uncharacterized membrane protein
MRGGVMGAMESVVTLIAGGIVTWSLVVRYQTINTPEFKENTRITIGVFFAFALGFLMRNPKKAWQIGNVVADIEILKLLFFISPLFIISIFQVLKGYHLSYVFAFQRVENAFFWVIDNLFILCFLIFIILWIYLGFSYDTSGYINRIIFYSWILSFFVFLGFIHSLFGTIVAGVNIAMILAHFFLEGTFGGGLGSVFDFFEMIGISSVPMKWAIMVISTFLGIHSAMSFDDMKDLIQNGLF